MKRTDRPELRRPVPPLTAQRRLLRRLSLPNLVLGVGGGIGVCHFDTCRHSYRRVKQ